MRNILVTGADGQLGRSLRRLARHSADNYLFAGRAELDLLDARSVRRALRANRVDAVVNCAAYTDVERAETDAAAADAVNRAAVRSLAEAALDVDAVLLHISTDFVFDGRSSRPYREEDPAAPLSVYGRTKLAGEAEIAAVGCRHLIFRTAWLYSEYGRNFVRTMLRLMSERTELRVVDDQTGTPTYAGDLAGALFRILDSGAYAARSGLYHYSAEGSCSWYAFACEIARLTGSACRILPCTAAEYGARAPRPAYSVLDKSKFKTDFGIPLPRWRTALARCLKNLHQPFEP